MTTRTIGISPKLIAAVVTAVITYIVGQELVELPAWVEMILQGVLVAGAVYAARPGTVVTEDADVPHRPSIRDERGEITRDMLLGALIVAVVVILIVVFV